jgi:hypothetical protein
VAFEFDEHVVGDGVGMDVEGDGVGSTDNPTDSHSDASHYREHRKQMTRVVDNHSFVVTIKLHPGVAVSSEVDVEIAVRAQRVAE